MEIKLPPASPSPAWPWWWYHDDGDGLCHHIVLCCAVHNGVIHILYGQICISYTWHSYKYTRNFPSDRPGREMSVPQRLPWSWSDVLNLLSAQSETFQYQASSASSSSSSSSAMPSTPQLSWSLTKPNFIFMQQRYYTSGLLKALLLNVDMDSGKYAPLTLWLFNLHSWHSETNPCSWCVAKIWAQHSKRPSGSTYSELTVCRLLSRIMGLTVPSLFLWPLQNDILWFLRTDVAKQMRWYLRYLGEREVSNPLIIILPGIVHKKKWICDTRFRWILQWSVNGSARVQ